MAAYVIVNIEVTDPVQYETYKRMAARTVAAHGGRYLVRGGTVEQLEGTWVPRRVVILEFPSMVQARTWWSSEDYRPARELRQVAATTQMVLVDGV